jgi:hypothetical protein
MRLAYSLNTSKLRFTSCNDSNSCGRDSPSARFRGLTRWPEVSGAKPMRAAFKGHYIEFEQVIGACSLPSP